MKRTITVYIEPEIDEAIIDLANKGDRSKSRQVERLLKERIVQIIEEEKTGGIISSGV